MTDANTAMVERVAAALGSLRERVVFVGGCATGLMLTDPAAAAIRTTLDVDLVVETADRREYRVLEKELLRRGFRHDASPRAPICRWTLDDLVVDVMPTDPALLGFSNRWYPEALRTAHRRMLPGGLPILLVDPPCFLATKIEAFYGRGEGDFLASHDLEDVVTLVDGRPEIVDEVASSAAALRTYLREEVGRLLDTEAFRRALPGHLGPDAATQARLPLLKRRLQAIAGRSAGEER